MAYLKEVFKVSGWRLTPVMDTACARYFGPSRKLIVALDIGTTFSGAAYALLDPGEVTQIRSVTRQVPPISYLTAVATDQTGIRKLRMPGPQRFPP